MLYGLIIRYDNIGMVIFHQPWYGFPLALTSMCPKQQQNIMSCFLVPEQTLPAHPSRPVPDVVIGVVGLPCEDIRLCRDPILSEPLKAGRQVGPGGHIETTNETLIRGRLQSNGHRGASPSYSAAWTYGNIITIVHRPGRTNICVGLFGFNAYQFYL